MSDVNTPPRTAVTKEETDKKCPSCGGVMDFDAQTGGLLCPFCGRTEEIPPEQNTPETAEEQDFFAAESTGNFNWGMQTKTVICKSCGGETVYDAMQIAGECPFCGSNQVMEAAEQHTLAPGGVCPFQISREQGGERFHRWLKRRIFCPREAKQKARPEVLTGLYLPYWTFDTQTASTYTARYGVNRTVRDRKGNTRTVIDWHHTAGGYEEFVDDQLVIASGRQDPALLSRVEPFNTAQNMAYQPEYLAGFAAERYSLGVKDGWERAKGDIQRRLESQVEQQIRRRHRADHVSNLRLQTRFSNITYKYLLLPVWLSTFTYRGKVYHFAVNGQTGKVGGKTPVSPWRVAVAALIGLAVLAVFMLLVEAA